MECSAFSQFQIDTIITPGNEDILHHAVLHACWGVDKEHMRGSDSKQGLCSAAEMPEFIESCHVTAYAWVVGGTVSLLSTHHYLYTPPGIR